MKRHHCVAALTALTVLAPSTSRAQLAIGCTDFACSSSCIGSQEGGDLNPALTSLPSSAVTAMMSEYGFDVLCTFGESACFSTSSLGGTAGADYMDHRTALRRVLNGVLLADQVPFWGDLGRTWHDVTSEQGIVDVEPHDNCDETGWTSTGTLAGCYLDIYRRPMMTSTVWERGSQFVHEARHCHDPVGTGHTSGCPAGNACDFSWNDEGGYQWTVAFLSQFADSAPALWSSADRVQALASANQRLNRNFVEHPGFWLYMGDDAAVRSWTFDAPAPSFEHVETAGYAIQQLSIHLEDVNASSDQWPVVLGLDVTSRRVQLDGTLGATVSASYGTDALDPADTLVIDVTTPADPDRVITRVRLAWGNDVVGAPSANERAVARVMTVRVSADGELVSPQEMSFGGGDSCGTATCPTGSHCRPTSCVPGSCLASCVASTLEPGVADYVAPSGEYLSGFWIGSGTDLPRFSIGGTSELTPGWLPQLGSGSAEAPFGLTQSWGCESSETAVGIMIAHDGAPIGVAFPGVFALLCAPSAQVAASAVLPDDLVLRHGGYLNTPPGSVQGVAAIWTFLSAWTGRDPVLESCGPGEALTGVRGREGSLVYRIDSIRCREVATEAPDQLYLNWGLFGGVPFDVQCPAGTHIHGGLVNHVEPSIAGLRFRCVGY